MNYAELHDAEINIKVCKALGLGLSGYARVIRQGDASILLDDNKTLVDWCNNPADAWPIIQQNKIDLTFGDDVHETLKGCCIASRRKLSYTHDNPLRAAMIVFLMMMAQ